MFIRSLVNEYLKINEMYDENESLSLQPRTQKVTVFKKLCDDFKGWGSRQGL